MTRYIAVLALMVAAMQGFAAEKSRKAAESPTQPQEGCYLACVEHAADGSDCVKTRQVCPKSQAPAAAKEATPAKPAKR